MTAFGTQTISYTENRADGGFAWHVGYNLSFINSVFQITEYIKLVGADPGASLRSIWENGIETTWNHKVFFADAFNYWYPVKLDVAFVSTGQHNTVTVHAGDGRFDALNWYTVNTSWGPAYYGILAAHETGHLLGNFDEYPGGATYNNFTRTGTLMSDLTIAGFKNYFWTVEFYGEYFGNMTLSTVLAPDLVSPGITAYQKMYGIAPSANETNLLADFNTIQYAYGHNIGVFSPKVYVYEALGLALAEQSDTGSMAFKSKYGPSTIWSDVTFVTQAYFDVFGVNPTTAQVQHFTDQVNFFKNLYIGSGAFGSDFIRIDLLARGAVYGQMIGFQAPGSPEPETTTIAESDELPIQSIVVGGIAAQVELGLFI